jgi:hypothetical protein
MKVVPANQTVQMSSPAFSVDIILENVSNLGAFEFTLSFDPDLVRLVGVRQGPFLGSTNRNIQCVQPRHFSPYSADPNAEAVNFGCNSVGNSPPGPNGSGVVATVEFAPRAAGTSSLGLGLTRDLYGIANVFGVDIYVVPESGSVTVEGSGPTSTPRPDEPTPIPTQAPPPIQQATPTRPADALSWLTPQPGETPMARLITDPDPSDRGTSGSAGTRSGAGRTGGSAQSDAGSADGSPRAGTGPPPHQTAWWPTLAGGLLAAGGVTLLSLAYYIRPRQARRNL